MRWQAIFALLGLIVCLFSLTMLPPIVIDLIFGQKVAMSFVYAFLSIFLFGVLLTMFAEQKIVSLRKKEGLVLVVLIWFTLSHLSALPFIFGAVDVSLIDAIFEAVSGLTTTGTDVFTGLEQLPRAVIYYRQQLELVGGLGVVVFASLILPFLGVGGLQLYQSEITGPIRENKWLPRIQESLMAFLMIYTVMLVLCVLGYSVGGMPFFDAMCEAFATISTGGFSIHDGSFAVYDNPIIQITCMFFMVMSGLNFSCHFYVLTRTEWSVYWRHFESRVFLQVLVIMVILVACMGWWYGLYHSTYDAVLQSMFTVISMATTTGFSNTDFASWPSCLPPLMLFLAMLGGCSGSTAGGIKTLRSLFIFREGVTELKRMLHPQAVFSVQHDDEDVPSSVLDSIRGFLSIFLIVYVLLILLVMLSGLPFYDAFAAVTTCLSNVGASIAGVADGFSHLGVASKSILIVAMLAGRLEIMMIAIMAMPSFWRS